MNARAAAERTSTASPSARLESGVVAVVEADLAREEPVLVELSITGAGDRIHLVEALPGEADAGRAVAAVEAALDRAEDELATTLGVEADVGGLGQGDEVPVPQRHLDDPPLAEQGMVAGGHQDLAGSSAGLARPAARSGIDGSRELPGLPGPRQQPLELVRLGPARDHALEHVGQPRLRLDPVELGGRHQACHDRPVARPAVTPGEQGILAPQGHHGVILPMSGRRSWSTTAGIRCTGGASGGTTARIVSPVASCTSRWRPAWSRSWRRGCSTRSPAPGWSSARRACRR